MCSWPVASGSLRTSSAGRRGVQAHSMSSRSDHGSRWSMYGLTTGTAPVRAVSANLAVYSCNLRQQAGMGGNGWQHSRVLLLLHVPLLASELVYAGTPQSASKLETRRIARDAEQSPPCGPAGFQLSSCTVWRARWRHFCCVCGASSQTCGPKRVLRPHTQQSIAGVLRQTVLAWTCRCAFCKLPVEQMLSCVFAGCACMRAAHLLVADDSVLAGCLS